MLIGNVIGIGHRPIGSVDAPIDREVGWGPLSEMAARFAAKIRLEKTLPLPSPSTATEMPNDSSYLVERSVAMNATNA